MGKSHVDWHPLCDVIDAQETRLGRNQMNFKKQTRSRKPNQRKSKPRVRKSKKTSIIPALIIESMAVVAILVLFFGLRADLNNQSRMKHRGQGAIENPVEFAQQERRVGLLAQPTVSATRGAWTDWSSN